MKTTSQMKSTRKGHTYHYFYCSKKCGASVIPMDEIDKSAREYLEKLLNDENQQKIADALRQYKGGEKQRINDFYTILKKKIAEKQEQHRKESAASPDSLFRSLYAPL